MENYRDTYAEISLQKLINNAKYIYEKSSKSIMAIVKANAYGHGAVRVAETLEKLDFVQAFGVATLGEGMELRDAGIKKDILVLGATRADDLEVASENNISVSVFSMDFIEDIKNLKFKTPLKVHVKIDTGMNRIGLKDEKQFSEALLLLKNNDNFIIDGVFTHYGAADELNDTYEKQFEKYKTIIGENKFKYMHAANSAGALYHKENFTNIVRAGIALYGIEPNGTETTLLQQVMSLKTKVVMVKDVKKDESIGYGFTYKVKNNCRIATLPIGYADGIIRRNQNRLVCINNNYFQIVGRVCMDQMMVKVDSSVKAGDIVEIFGENISLNQMAKELHTIPYEILVLLSLRINRVYV